MNRFNDGFDHYDTADILDKWTRFGTVGGSDCSINTTNQRTGRGCMEVGANGVTKTVGRFGTWIVGAAINFQQNGEVFWLLDIDTVQVSLFLQGDGTFAVRQGGPPLGPILGMSDTAFAISFGRYYYLEMKVVIGGSGSVELRINGQQILLLTGVNTQATSRSTADVLQLLGPGGGFHAFYDDLYVNDDQGGVNDDFWGDTRIGLIMAISDGDFSQWTPNSGTAHFSRINEVPPDGDTSYVSSDTVNDEDTYHFQPVNPADIYKAIQTNIVARKDDEGNRSIALVSRTGGSDQVSPERFVGENYIDYLNQFDVNPFTGLPWTGADINAMQWGVKVIT